MCTNYIKLEITTKGKATKYTRVDMILYSISGYTCFILKKPIFSLQYCRNCPLIAYLGETI